LKEADRTLSPSAGMLQTSPGVGVKRSLTVPSRKSPAVSGDAMTESPLDRNASRVSRSRSRKKGSQPTGVIRSGSLQPTPEQTSVGV